MPASDGLLLRVKPTAAQLSAAQLAALAEAAARDGNGKVQLTSRANLQLRGFSASTVERFTRTVIDLGLAGVDAAGEAVRNVLSAPLAGADPHAEDARPFAIALETLLTSDRAMHALPPKFGCAVDGGGLAVLPRSADVLIVLQEDRALIGLPDTEVAHRTAATPAAVTAAVRALALTLLSQQARRMRHLVEEVGGERIFALSGLAAEAFVPPHPRPLPVGYSPYGDGLGCFAAALPFGLGETPALLTLAAVAERHGGGRIATTPWRSFALPAVAEPQPVATALAAAGFIVNSADPRLSTTESAPLLEGVAELLE
jgi:precorrin-3B synthase